MSKSISEYFGKLRMDKSCHLGLGDIRLTVSQQMLVCDMAKRQNAALRTALQQIAELSDSGEYAEYASAEIARKALDSV